MNPLHLSFKNQAQGVDVSLSAILCGEEASSCVSKQILGLKPQCTVRLTQRTARLTQRAARL